MKISLVYCIVMYCSAVYLTDFFSAAKLTVHCSRDVSWLPQAAIDGWRRHGEHCLVLNWIGLKAVYSSTFLFRHYCTILHTYLYIAAAQLPNITIETFHSRGSSIIYTGIYSPLCRPLSSSCVVGQKSICSKDEKFGVAYLTRGTNYQGHKTHFFLV